MTLRINKRQTDVGAYLRQLKQAGIVATALDDTAVVLEKPVSVSRLPGFSSGLSSVQDWGAQHAARLLDAHDSARVLDACSAPGGKTAHVLECADIQLTAVDIDSARQQKTPQNLERLRLSARCVTGDILQPEEWWDGIPFHRVLLDAPCSASGVTRRHPDIKWLRRESDIQHYADTQGKMLDALWRLLSKGGKLLYTTCSVFAEENQSQILAFLGRHHDAQQLPLGLSTLCNGQLLPGEYHDGFFYALLLKR
jgi:16S rRNA (cytosine967-C5)-methyltransferase